MGHNIHILGEASAPRGLEHGHAITLELEECVHFHLEEFRFMWRTSEFLEIAKAFSEAHKRVLELSSPSSLPKMEKLGQVILQGDRLHQDRMAVEVTKNGTIHLHYKSFRLHMTAGDFYCFADMIREAMIGMSNVKIYVRELDIQGSNILYPHVALAEYLPMLNNMDLDSYKAEDTASLAMEVRKCIRSFTTVESNLQRPGGNLPVGFNKPIDPELNKQYLGSLYQSISKHGYAKGPYEGEYMQVFEYPNNEYYLKGAHRTACLLKLGYTNIPVLIHKLSGVI